MIIEKQERTVGEITYNYLFHSSEYYACGYGDDNIIQLYTAEYEQIGANLETASMLNGFGATTWVEFLAEIEKRGLIFP
jgi:hypothetical protein